MKERDDVDRIVELVNQGKTYGEVADELGYSSKSAVSYKLKREGYNRHHTLSEANQGKQYVASFPAEKLEEAGINPENHALHYKIKTKENKIILELSQNKIELENKEEDEK